MTRYIPAVVIASTLVDTDESLTGPRILQVTTLHHVSYTGADGPLYSTSIFDSGVPSQADPVPTHTLADAERMHAVVVDTLAMIYGAR